MDFAAVTVPWVAKVSLWAFQIAVAKEVDGTVLKVSGRIVGAVENAPLV